MLIAVKIRKSVELRNINVNYFIGDLPECARLSGNSDESLDDRDLQRALEDSSRDAKKQRQQHGKNQIKSLISSVPLALRY